MEEGQTTQWSKEKEQKDIEKFEDIKGIIRRQKQNGKKNKVQ